VPIFHLARGELHAHLPEKSVELSSVLQFLLHHMPDHVRKREAMRPGTVGRVIMARERDPRAALLKPSDVGEHFTIDLLFQGS
jgi:hypothetical protein